MVNPSREYPTTNVAYMEDKEYSIQVNRWFLKTIGAWPKVDLTSRPEKIFRQIISLTCHFLIAFTVIPSMMFVFFEEATIQARLKGLGPMSHWAMGALNYYSLLLTNKNIYQCVKHIETDWRLVQRAQDRELMLKNAKVGRFIAFVSALCMYLGILWYCLLYAIKKIEVPIGNQTITMFQLPCPFYNKLLDIRYSPINEIVFAMYFVSSYVVTSSTVSACGLAAVFAMHACGQLSVLGSWLDDLVEEQKKGYAFVQNKLASIVQHHLRVLSFISCIENIMHRICLVELIGCTLNLCMLGYYSLTEWHTNARNVPTYVVIFMSMTFNIFIFCYIGEILSEKCKEVGRRAYMTNWYLLPPKIALSLVLIISRSNVVIKITAGKLVQLSIATFGDVIKTSFAYLNMLRTVVM